jgi:hypothetical protein
MTLLQSSEITDGVSTLLEELHQILLALVGGARYGIKIRLPHALVMTLLFRRDLSDKEKLKNILRLVLEHASNLAAFATIYKTLLAALKWTSVHLRDCPRHHSVSDGLFISLGRKLGTAASTSLLSSPANT